MITKIIVRRLQHIMPKLVALNQTSFIQGRSISENVIINQEVIHSMKHKKDKDGWMAIKVDLKKAFDRLRWDFIADTLYEAGFPPTITRLILHCISSSTMQIQFNGGLSSEFQPQRGVRQGDLISPYLFVLTMERLDDLILYAKATTDQAILIENILAEFGHYSVSNLGVYLGMTVMHKRATCEFYAFIVDKIKSKLQGWSARSLSFAGRVTLAKSVLMAISTYFMQTCRFPSKVYHDIEKIVRHFIWTSNDQSRGIPIVSWDSLSQPRHNGGLDIRRLQQYNSAFLMKLFFAVASNTETYFIKLLRQKYKVTSMCPPSIMRLNCSYLWRSLSKVWDNFHSFISWSVGDGASTRFWHDNWLPKLGRLSNWKQESITIEDNLMVCDVSQSNSSWNWNFIRQTLQPSTFQHILNVQPPNPNANTDRCSWFHGKNGEFSVKSAYNLITKELWNHTDVKWIKLWRLPIPERIKHFLWISYRDRLLTNVNRCERNLTDDPLCQICVSVNETLLHVLRDCKQTASLWQLIIRQQQLQDFFTLGTNEWLMMNLDSNRLFAGSKIPWKTLFASLACKNWANYFITTTPDSSTGTAFPRPELIQWRPAPTGWFALNTDDAVHHTSSLGSAGGIIRNKDGDWIVGFNKAVGISSLLQAELWGILEGLQLAWSQRLEHIQCQTDCAEALTLVTSSTAASSPVSIVRSITSLILKQWKVDFILIRREGNAAADFLAKSTVISNDQPWIYIEPPQEIIPHLARDLHGPAFTRS
ncbi:hypothetical protein F3Y22_tig00002237pilonHSYRG00293 [Hibiscus syriacus]|uniref:Uncharacterized protein n=1 Tax=Hibiscus syriacus TaxID=106335 RepID=A0A6A3CXM8_HIBSY|nr:hypothetical protein F3Y22_tig00002237pilonHSYRG00293 [Hibiscus syriacus]